MSKSTQAAVAVIVNDDIKNVIDMYADATAQKKSAESIMAEKKPLLVNVATNEYNAHEAEGVKSITMTSGKNIAMVTFASSFALNTNVPAFEKVKDLACIQSVKSICIRSDKAEEVTAFLRSLGREDLIVETTAYSLNRDIFDSMEKVPTYANRSALLECLEQKITPAIKITAVK